MWSNAAFAIDKLCFSLESPYSSRCVFWLADKELPQETNKYISLYPSRLTKQFWQDYLFLVHFFEAY